MQTETPRLTMKFAAGFVKHLGLQMYSSAVSAISELISNAWDADADSVSVTIPFGQAVGPDDVIVVRDDGHGMTFGECNDHYLVLGRERRIGNGGRSRTKGRKVIGRKGIGKLAGFGIASRVCVRTVCNGRLTEFLMDYDVMTETGKFGSDYAPELLAADIPCAEPSGTTITLTGLKRARALDEDDFRRNLARRFGLNLNDFKILINKKPLSKVEIPLQYRFPPATGEWSKETVPGVGEIRWWIGFTHKPIPEDANRGVSILANGKLVQEPWFFELTRGFTGQFGLEYLTGEVVADGLDAEEDLIATDRATVLWEHEKARSLQEWGQGKIKELTALWAKERANEKLRSLEQPPQQETPPVGHVQVKLDIPTDDVKVPPALPKPEVVDEPLKSPFKSGTLRKRMERFPDIIKLQLADAIDKLTEMHTLEPGLFRELVEFIIKAYENEHFMTIVRQLNAADIANGADVLKVLQEWDIIEAIAMAQMVRTRVEIIYIFESMIKAKSREKPEMQNYLRLHPWLIDPTWAVLQHEKRLDTILDEEFGIPATGKAEQRRLDFFCIADSGRVVVVEVKRPGDKIGLREVRQLADYVSYLRRKEKKNGDPQRANRLVTGCLVFHKLDEEADEEQRRLLNDGFVFRTWDRLVETAVHAHREFYDKLTTRIPADDPRLAALNGSNELEPTSEGDPSI